MVPGRCPSTPATLLNASTDSRSQGCDQGQVVVDGSETPFSNAVGTGISVSYSTGILIEGNRVIEENFVPTPEIKAKYKLGDFVKRNPQKGAGSQGVANKDLPP